MARGRGDIPPAAGVHRQVLFTTVGWFVGYYLVKRMDYVHAKLDRELFEYVRQHPADFKAAGTISWWFVLTETSACRHVLGN